MVIDMLNVAAQMEHQEAVWGAPSHKIRDYTERNLHKQFRSPGGQALQQIIDPYQYRQQLTQPKLIILGTNDPYWPLDALNLYWPDLTGEKYILYVPNNAHGLNDYGRVFGSLNAVHRRVIDGQRLPQLTWQFAEQDGQVRLTVHSEPAAQRVVAWVAEAPTQDFREARWKSLPTDRAGTDDVFSLPVPQRGFAAVFGEAEYRSGDAPSFFSTNVRIVKGKE
jgi:PhoPQ-activated pathogenicity-related protein